MKKLIALFGIALFGASAAVTIPVTTTNWYFSPYNWRSNGGSGALLANNVQTGATSVTCVALGCYFKASVFNNTTSPSTIDLTITTSCGACKVRSVVIPANGYGGTYTDSTITSGQTSIAIASAAQTIQTVQLWVFTASATSDKWTSATETITITNMQLATGGSLQVLTPGGSGQSQITNEAGKIVVFGDSITEGAKMSSANDYDAPLSWVPMFARAFNAEYGQVGYSCQGWSVGACSGSNVPAFPSSWSNYTNGVSRLFSSKLSPLPSMVVAAYGTNDGATDVTSTIQSWITAARAAVNTTTPILLVVPLNRLHESQIRAAVVASGDLYVFVASMDGQAQTNTSMSGISSSDGLHPNQTASSWLAAKLVRSAQYYLDATRAWPFPSAVGR